MKDLTNEKLCALAQAGDEQAVDKANAWKIIYLDEDLDDAGEDTLECLIASPNVKSPERIYIERETAAELHEAMDELHAVELRLKSQRKCGRKITAAVYKYLADCDGAWGELHYDFKDGTAEIILLAEWDTMVSHRFAVRAIEYLKEHCGEALPEKITLTFIGPEQRSRRYDNKFEAGN